MTKDSLEDLFERSHAQLFRALFSFTGGRRDVAEEAVAEAFARAIPRYERIENPLPWLYQTAFRCAAKELGRKEPSIETGTTEHDGDIQDFVRLMRMLSPNQRAAIVLRYEMDLPVKEVAARLGISATTASVHIHRGHKRLQELLEREGIHD